MRSHLWLPAALAIIVVIVIVGIILLPSEPIRNRTETNSNKEKEIVSVDSAQNQTSTPLQNGVNKENEDDIQSDTTEENKTTSLQGDAEVEQERESIQKRTGPSSEFNQENDLVANATAEEGGQQEDIKSRENIIAGIVKDMKGWPIRGVKIQVEGGKTFNSEEGGRFVIRELPQQNVTLIVTHKGYQPLRKTGVQVGTQDLELTLVKVGTLSGRVVDQFDNPIAFANISMKAIQGIWMIELTADSQGRFEAGNAPETKVKITASQDGFTDNGGGSREVESPSPEEIVLRLEQPAFSISGSVVMRDTRQGVAGFKLIAKYESTVGEEEEFVTTTDGSGLYRFDNLKRGNYIVSSFNQENAASNVVVPLEDDYKSVRLYEWDAKNVNFEVVPGQQINGKVVTSNGDPVAGAEITIARLQSVQTTSGFDGTFQLSGVPVTFLDSSSTAAIGRGFQGIQLFATHPDYGTGLSDPLPADPQADLSNIVITLQSLSSLSGTLTDQSGAAVADAQIILRDLLRGEVWERRTNGQGVFQFEKISTVSDTSDQYGGTHSIEVVKEGYGTLRREIMIPAGGSQTLNLTLQGGGGISGTVTDHTGSALADVEVTGFLPTGGVVTTRSDMIGQYYLSSLPDGAFDLSFRLNTNPPLSGYLYQIPAGSTNVDIALTPSEWLVNGGVYNAETMEPIRQFHLTIEGNPLGQGGRKYFREKWVNSSDGTFQLRFTEPGEYRVRFNADGYYPYDGRVRCSPETRDEQFLNGPLEAKEGKGNIGGIFIPPQGMALSRIDVLGYQSFPASGNEFMLPDIPLGVYDLLFYVRDDNTMGIKQGVLPSVTVREGETTNLGQITVQRLPFNFRDQ